MTPAEARRQIAAGETGPLYLLEGDDPQARHDLALEFGQLVDEGLHAFNVESFHANEATTAGARDQMIGALLAAARTLPMMAPRRVLIVHDADRLLSPKRGRDEGQEVLPDVTSGKRRRAAAPVDELEAYVAAPEAMTTVVFDAGPLDANRRLVKLLRRHAAVVDCGTLETAAEAAAWIRRRLEKDELSIEPAAIQRLLDATGLALGRLRAEVEKLVLYAAGASAITVRHVDDLVLPLQEPGEDFALGRAIWDGRAPDALREVAAQLDAGIPPPMILGQVRAAAGRLRPDTRVRPALDLVFRTDLALKSSAGEPRYLLERLVVELCWKEGGSTRLR
ncbi:MAG: DNA polymerase III subunit delta [Acidobacteriota bacterium]